MLQLCSARRGLIKRKPSADAIADVAQSSQLPQRAVQSGPPAVMNPEERVVTWLISLGVLDSPKKTIGDPEEFLKSSLKNGVVLCKLINRLRPGSVEKVRHGLGIASRQITALMVPLLGGA